MREILKNKIVFELQADHPRICVFGYVCILLVWPWPWPNYPIYELDLDILNTYTRIAFQTGQCFQKSAPEPTHRHTDRQTRPNALPAAFVGDIHEMSTSVKCQEIYKTLLKIMRCNEHSRNIWTVLRNVSGVVSYNCVIIIIIIN